MKSIILLISIIGLCTVEANSVAESIDEIKSIIPIEEIKSIFDECREDPEIQIIQAYLRSAEFEAAINVIRDKTEIQEFFDELGAKGVDFVFFNFFFNLWGIPFNEFTKDEQLSKVAVEECGGWRGLYGRIDELITLQQLGDKINMVYERDAEFQYYWSRMRGAEELVIQIFVSEEWIVVFQTLEDLGVDLDRIVEALYVFFGWEL